MSAAEPREPRDERGGHEECRRRRIARHLEPCTGEVAIPAARIDRRRAPFTTSGAPRYASMRSSDRARLVVTVVAPSA
jgi:hypothetical protein